MSKLGNSITITGYMVVSDVRTKKENESRVVDIHVGVPVKHIDYLRSRIKTERCHGRIYMCRIIYYADLDDNVPDDVITKYIKSIYDSVGRDQLEDKPIDIGKIITTITKGLSEWHQHEKDKLRMLEVICQMVSCRTFRNTSSPALSSTRKVLSLAIALESVEILDNVVKYIVSGLITTGCKYVRSLIEYLGEDTSSLTPDVTIIASRVSEMLVESGLVKPSDVYMDTGSIVRLLGLFERNIKDGNLSLNKVYDILFSIGYIKTSKGSIMNITGSLEDYLILCELGVNRKW